MVLVTGLAVEAAVVEVEISIEGAEIAAAARHRMTATVIKAPVSVIKAKITPVPGGDITATEVNRGKAVMGA